jgi:hypothetical protein
MYNPFRWWTKGRKNKPLKATAPLLLKIRNGDFDYSYMFNEVNVVREEADRIYKDTYNNYIGSDERNRKLAAEDSSRMKRVKVLKLMEEAHKNELKLLHELRNQLRIEFSLTRETDLWDKAMEKKRGKGTIEDLYWWYKKQVKEVTTYSEIDIQLRRKNTNGLEHLFKK